MQREMLQNYNTKFRKKKKKKKNTKKNNFRATK